MQGRYPGRFARALSVAGLVVAMGVSCKASPDRAILGVRDALTRGDLDAALAVKDPVECHETTRDPATWRCLESLARALGNQTGFAPENPDGASMAAVGVWLLRAKHGDWVPQSDAWLTAAAGAEGPGADTLRLAVATAMADEAKVVRKNIADEAAGRAVLAAVARSIPGACDTYADLGRGAAIADVLLAETPEHSPCVAHDLDRAAHRTTFEDGWPRAVSAAIALWEAEGRALDLGQDRMSGAARVALGEKLALVRVATNEVGPAWEKATRAGSPHP